MAVGLLSEFVLLFQMACVVFLVGYLFSKSRFYAQVLEHRATLATQIFLAIVFGLLSVYGMSSGISFYTATVNIRDFGPMAAGLACGPYVGLGAGIIGFIYRLSVGGTNVYAVALGPLAAGIIGGLVYYYRKGNLVTVKIAVIITVITETFISMFALVVRILAGDSVEKVMTVAINVALPMTIMTSVAVGVFCFILNNQIRERQVQNEKLHLELEVKSKMNLSTIINTIAYPVYVLDRDHHFTLVNDSMCRFIGRPHEEILGKTTRDFFSKDDSAFHWDMTEDVFQRRATREDEVSITLPDGETCTLISTAALYTDASNRIFMVGVIRDISERKLMEEALKDRTAKLNRAEKVARFGHWEFHLDTKAVITSEGAKIIYGLDDQEKSISDVQKIPLPEFRPALDAAMKGLTEEGRPYNVEFKIRRATDDAIIYIHSIAEYDPTRRVVFGVINDITERKRAEEGLCIATRKLNLLSSITRHDILNQVSVLQGSIQIIMKGSTDPQQIRWTEAAKRAARTIYDQILFTRDYQDMGVKAPTWQKVNLAIIQAKGALPVRQIQITLDREDLEVFADPLFEKIFYNLIDNALKYSGKELTKIEVSSQENEEGLVITCADDGTGISQEDKKHLFERGFGKNTGLGLFLSREILAITGFTITEDGEPGKGARFRITVPKGSYRFAIG